MSVNTIQRPAMFVQILFSLFSYSHIFYMYVMKTFLKDAQEADEHALLETGSLPSV
jgi:hypothetical protein